MHKMLREAIPLHRAHRSMHCHLLTAVACMGELAWEITLAKAKWLLWPRPSCDLVNINSSLLWLVFHYFFFCIFFILKIRGKKGERGDREERKRVHGTRTCSGLFTDFLNLTQFVVTHVCMPHVSSCRMSYSWFLLYHIVLPFRHITNSSVWGTMQFCCPSSSEDRRLFPFWPKGRK